MKKDDNYSQVEAFRYLILAVQRQGNRIFNDMLKETGLTASQAEVIRILEDWGNLSLKELGKLLICETGSPSRLIDRMFQDGLVEKIPDPKDSRYVVLHLTAEGMEKAKAVGNVEKQLDDRLKEIYSEDEFEYACSLLLRFLRDQPISDALKKRGYDK